MLYYIYIYIYMYVFRILYIFYWIKVSLNLRFAVSFIDLCICIYSSYDEKIQRKQSAQYRKRRAITVKVPLISARCDTVFHIRDDDDDLQTGAEDGWVLFP